MTSQCRDPGRGDLGHEERHRQRDQRVDHGDRRRDADAAQGHVAVDRLGEDRAEVVEGRLAHELPVKVLTVHSDETRSTASEPR